MMKSMVIAFVAALISIVQGQTTCGGTLTNPTGQILTPNYPRSYNFSTNCTWVIVAPANNQIVLYVEDFLLEDNYKCKFDFLEIRRGGTQDAPSLGTYCGRHIPKTLVVAADRAFLRFTSDHQVKQKGFNITYDSTNPRNVTAPDTCGGYLTSLTGQIISPDYPQKYTYETECVWTIVAPVGRQITLRFWDFALEDDDECAFDFLRIRTGTEATSTILGTYCGKSMPATLTLDANTASLVFVSDHTSSQGGFNITYDATSSGCGRSLSGVTGIFASPNYPARYPTGVRCAWQMSTNYGWAVRANFSYVTSRYLEIRDRNSAGSKMTIQDSSPSNQVFVSITNTLWVQFLAAQNIADPGFIANYSSVCATARMVADTGIIETMGYPADYQPFMDCEWTIEAPSGGSLNLTFETFVLEDRGCHFDNLTVSVYDRATKVFSRAGTYCGRQPPPAAFASNVIKLRFRSDRSGEYAGFRFRWTSTAAAVPSSTIPASSASSSSADRQLPLVMPDDATAGGSGVDVGAVVGGVIGAVVGTVLVAVGVVAGTAWLRRRREAAASSSLPYQDMGADMGQRAVHLSDVREA